MHLNPHSYILCIPRVEYSTTKMDVARAVENQIGRINSKRQNSRVGASNWFTKLNQNYRRGMWRNKKLNILV